MKNGHAPLLISPPLGTAGPVLTIRNAEEYAAAFGGVAAQYEHLFPPPAVLLSADAADSAALGATVVTTGIEARHVPADPTSWVVFHTGAGGTIFGPFKAKTTKRARETASKLIPPDHWAACQVVPASSVPEERRRVRRVDFKAWLAGRSS